MRNLAFVFALCTAAGTAAQSELFRSYDAFAQGTGERVEGPIEVVPRMGRWVVAYRQAGRQQHIPARKLWGFRNQGFLYRIEPEGRLPVRLMAQGAVYYWENGLAHLRMQRDTVEAAGIQHGHAAYLSRDVQAPIVPARFSAEDHRSSSARFRQAWPAYAPLLDRIGADAPMDSVRQCVVDYNVAVEEGRAVAP